MNSQMRQPRFLHRQNLATLILFRHGMDVIQRPDSGGNKPWQPQNRVHGNHDPNDNCIVVVRISMRQLVCGMVDQVPRDTVVQENEDKCQHRRTRSHERHPRLAIQIGHINDPTPVPVRSTQVGTLLGPVRRTRRRTTRVRGGESIRDVQFFRGHGAAQDVSNNRHYKDGRYHRKVRNDVANSLIREEGGEFEFAQEERELDRAQAENQG
mmetsp:Transcript_15306/g.19146  ORF Transcript_15306/g.19146 Transcript_15306/m.19146 type:complete len:210 (-) Transcript_15306:867-1496(-)